jgi:hypothetical protein
MHSAATGANCSIDSLLQWEADLRLEPSKREWLHFEVDEEGKEPLVILGAQAMLRGAVERGHCEPIYMDATHGMQRCVLKVVTVHVKDIEGTGAHNQTGRTDCCPAQATTWL